MGLFRVLQASKKSRARVGELYTTHGTLATPFFMTIATYGAVKSLAAQDLRALNAPILLSNTYHLWVRPGLPVIKKAGGLHNFMGWSGPILTDSGGYQVFSLSTKSDSRARGNDNTEKDYDVRLTREGAEFIDRKSGRKDMFTPERVLDIQRALGSDIAMVLDVCAPYPVSKEEARKAMELTSEWAKRSEVRGRKSGIGNLVFGIVQGSIYKDLRARSAREITELNFDGYAIGGVAVGETARQKQKVVEWVVPYLPKDKPRYLMGLGQPEELMQAVSRGIDMFDCVLPTRNARHGLLYVRRRSRKLQTGVPNFYNLLHITNQQFRYACQSVDPDCPCLLCQEYTRAYLHHLFKVGDPLSGRLASLHNVHFYLELMKELREMITAGRL